MSLVKQVVLAPIQDFNENQLSESVAIYRQDGTQLAPASLGGNQQRTMTRAFYSTTPANDPHKLLQLVGEPSELPTAPAVSEIFGVLLVNGNTATNVDFAFEASRDAEGDPVYGTAMTIISTTGPKPSPDIPPVAFICGVSSDNAEPPTMSLLAISHLENLV